MKAGKGMYCCCNKKEPTGCATGFKMGKKSRLDLDFSQIKKLVLFSAKENRGSSYTILVTYFLHKV